MNEFSMHDATREGEICRVMQLIEAGVPVDSLNEEGQTPLHLAARYGQYEVARLLLNSKCVLDIKDCSGDTPLWLAAGYDNKEIVDLLLHRGAQVNNCVDDSGWSLLHCASCSTGWPDVVRVILDNGEADVNAVDKNGLTPLMCAANGGNEEIAALLIIAGADVNRIGPMKRTALHWAVLLRSTRVIPILLEKEGLDLSPQDYIGDTPLHLACHISVCREAIKQLLDAGANPDVKNNRGRTALRQGVLEKNLTHEEIRLFVQKGAFLEMSDYLCISRNPFIKEEVLKDVELCAQSVVNKFNRQSLPALNNIPYFARRLPNVDNFKLGARHIDEVKNLVKFEIERNTFCNVVKIHPISLSALCDLSLITFQSDKKQATSPGFGHLPFKKIHN